MHLDGLLARLAAAHAFDPAPWATLRPLLISPPPRLAALLHRLPPLTHALAALLAHPDQHTDDLRDAFALLFPHAARRLSIDALGELLRTIFRATYTPLSAMVLREYRRSLGVASPAVKKKVYNNFVQNDLQDWIKAVVRQEYEPSVLSVGIDTLLSLEVLRTTDCHRDAHLVDRLAELIHAGLEQDILDFLPEFYASYVRALYRHRGQLFNHGGGSTRDGFRNAACLFLGVLLDLVDGSFLAQVWRTRLQLLRVLLDEGAYVCSEGEGEKSPQMLSKIVGQAVGVLEKPCTIESLAIQTLSTAIRIDYDIVRPLVPRILNRLLVLPLGMEREAYIEFLDLLLECHVKTRKLDELVSVMLSSIWEGSCSKGVSKERQGVVVEDDPFLGRLGKAIGGFGTVGQCVGLVGCVVDFVERGLGALEGVEGRDEEVEGGECVDLSLELGARIACVVLAFLNFEMLDEGVQNLRVVRGRVDRVVGRLVRRLGLFERMEGELEHGLCALLRVKYIFDRDVFVLGPGEEGDDGGMLEGLMHLLDGGKKSLLPSLVFELARAMFLHISTRRKQLGPSATSVVSGKGSGGKGKERDNVKQANGTEKFFDTLLAFVERYYPRKETNTGWSGTDYDLSTRGKKGKTKCAIALVWMIVERWLSELDLLATPRQIRRFLDVAFGVEVVDMRTEEKVGMVNPEGILLNILHSAWFWEFGRIRKELVELLKGRTLSNRLEGDTSDAAVLKGRISTFRLLLYFPLEYFSFQVLNGFVGCAIEVDEDLASKRDEDEEEVLECLVVLRVLMKRVCLHVGGGSVLDFRGKSEAELLLRMLEEPIVMDCDGKEAYMNASLDLVEVWLTRLFKSSKKTNDPGPVLRVLKKFNLDLICGNGKGYNRTLTAECFIRMVELLDRDMGLGTPNGADVHEDVLEALRELRVELVEGLYVRIVKDVSKEGLEDAIILRRYVGLVRVWDSLICLGRCVGGLADEQPPSRFLADKLVRTLMPHVKLRNTLDDGMTDLCNGVFAITLGEAECGGGGEQEGEGRWQSYLEVVLAIYISWANKVSVSGIKEMDVRLGRTAKRMAVVDFEHLLSFVAELLLEADPGWTSPKSRLLLESRLIQLVHVGSLLIRDHPSHSMACIQKFMARCLGLFNDNPVYVEGDVALRLQVLEMVGQYCSDQQAVLRAQDTSLIWLLVSKVLAPCRAHDSDTRPEIFHKVVSILTCLIRLRRDLVALGLPHLGLILRRMVQALRGCRPNLGAKQMAMVMNTQPRWISHMRSLGGEEAKALSRLLGSLTLKTTVRVAFSNADASKPESLAKPFSKHAAYVLKAYVEAVNDPLCVMSLEVRKELKEGLFALCGMMSVHSRDALMVGGGLDAGEKGVLKSVWKEWEEVRYVGKG